jgi:UDP-3-O-acyl-N-acetylglucosamine deacetylase
VSERPQRTIGSEIELTGVGLHTGETVKLRLLPANPGNGVLFRRTDLPESPEIPARIEFMHDAPRRTCLKSGAAEVHTTEHLLAALTAAGIDNVVCEMDGPEVPGLDGSSLEFLAAIEKAKVKEQKDFLVVHTLTDPIHVTEGDIASLLQAKAAIAAGIICLLDRVGMGSQDVTTLFLAGGFGFHMNVQHAIDFGLLPGFRASQVQLIGNSSLAGAYLALLDSGALDEIVRIGSAIETVELNLEPQFESTYIDQLSLGN